MTDLVLDSELTSEQRENLVIVKSSAEALLTVINDILDFSRIEAGKLELDPIDFNPRDAIGDTANTVALRAHQKGLELIMDVDAAVPHAQGRPRTPAPDSRQPPGQCHQVHPPGRVVLRVTSGRRPRTPSCCTSRSGIPASASPDRQQRVFEPVPRADGSMTRTYDARTRPDHLLTARAVDGRSSLAGVSSARQHVPLHGEFRVGPGPAVMAAVLMPSICGPARSSSTATSRTSACSGDAHRVADGPSTASSMPEGLAARAAQESGRPFALVIADVQMPEADGTLAGRSRRIRRSRTPHL
jgi:hypothetical protein